MRSDRQIAPTFETVAPNQVIDPGQTAEYPVVTQGSRLDRLPVIGGMSRRTRAVVLGAPLTALAATVGLGALSSNKAVNLPPTTESAAAAVPLSEAVPAVTYHFANCDDGSIDFSSFPGHPEQIVPATNKVSSSDQASTYNKGLFNKANQGTNIDPSASATFYALMGYQATNTSTNNESVIHSIYSNAMNQMTGNGETNNSAAQAYCDINEEVTSQTVNYDATAIAKNVPYTQISSVVGPDGHIDDISFTQHTAHSNTIGGVTYELQNDTSQNNLNGFNEVIIPANGHGVIDVLGLLPNSNSNNEQNQGTSGSTPNNASANQQSQTPVSVPGGSSPNETVGSAGGAGTQAEGTNTGLSGTGSGGAPGGGSGGGVPTTTETAPPNTTTTSPPETTTTSPPQTTTTFNKPPVPTTVPAWGGN